MIVDWPRWEPIVNDEGILICRWCGETWSNHAMDGDCPDNTHKETTNDDS